MRSFGQRFLVILGVGVGLLGISVGTASAQLTDQTQTPNPENFGIKKSLAQQVGASRGDVMTPQSSTFIIKRDPARAIRRGRQLFQRKFTVAQGFGPRTGDGIGSIATDGSLGAGLVDSCAGCHGRPRGAAGFGGDVVTRPDSRDAPHLFGLGLQEMIGDEITHDLRAIRAEALAQAAASGQSRTLALSSKGTSYGSITAYPNGTVNTTQVVGVNPDLRVRPFFAQGGTMSMREFIVGAFNAEMGLECPDPDTYAASHGGVVTTPSGMVLDGTQDSIEAPPVSSVGEDSDGDGIANEIDVAVVDHMEFYLLNYFKPGTYKQTVQSNLGRAIFTGIGCASCHTPNMLIDHDRRVADVETAFDSEHGVINHMFASASLLLNATDDGSGYPSLKAPNGNSFLVRNIFADFKRHDLGPNFWERNYDGTITKQFMTEPLWGVGTSSPYGHDGRSINLEEVIMRHGGEAQQARDKFAHLPGVLRDLVLSFLGTLVLFPPDDTASNLDPGNPATPNYPVRGHGSIALGALFNDPTEGE